MRFAAERGSANVLYVGSHLVLAEQARKSYPDVRERAAVEVSVEMQFAAYSDVSSISADSWPPSAPRYVVVDAQAHHQSPAPIDSLVRLEPDFTLVLVEEMGELTCPAEISNAFGPVVAHFPPRDWRRRLSWGEIVLHR